MVGITVLTNAFLIDCTGKEPADGAAVVIEGERIEDVIRSGKVGPLKGQVDALDLKGRTLMPGLTASPTPMSTSVPSRARPPTSTATTRQTSSSPRRSAASSRR
jgi:hypothetical protein